MFGFKLDCVVSIIFHSFWDTVNIFVVRGDDGVVS